MKNKILPTYVGVQENKYYDYLSMCSDPQEILYEKVYDCPHNPQDLIRSAEWMDQKTLENITPNLISPHPNTYTYSKRLAEMLIRDEYPNLPVVIARPSIGKSHLVNC